MDRKPANLTVEQAAAVPLAGITALVGLRDLGQAGPGRQILLNGASGGVGTFAVQVAKTLGAEVTAVCSTRNIDLVRSLGADHVIDYTQDDFTLDRHRYDVVFDLVANRSLTHLRRTLNPAGPSSCPAAACRGAAACSDRWGLALKGVLASRLVRHRLFVFGARPSTENLAALRELVESEEVTPVIDRGYPLRETADAIRYLEVEHARAKVVITV